MQGSSYNRLSDFANEDSDP